MHMVGYYCSGLILEEYRTKVTRHTNDEYELFTHVHTSKCAVTVVSVTLPQANMIVAM